MNYQFSICHSSGEGLSRKYYTFSPISLHDKTLFDVIISCLRKLGWIKKNSL
jgi:hypothetical protein